MTMSKEKREEAALSAMETGSYVVYRGETYRIDTCEIEDGEVLISDPNTGSQSTLSMEDFLADESGAVLGLFPIFDNAEEDPTLHNAVFTKQQMDRLKESVEGLMDIINEALQ